MKKAIRILSLVVLVVTLGTVLIHAGFLLWIGHSNAGSVGIIGGADGMTAIFVTSRPARLSGLLLPVLGILLPIAGIVLTRKRR